MALKQGSLWLFTIHNIYEYNFKPPLKAIYRYEGITRYNQYRKYVHFMTRVSATHPKYCMSDTIEIRDEQLSIGTIKDTDNHWEVRKASIIDLYNVMIWREGLE